MSIRRSRLITVVLGIVLAACQAQPATPTAAPSTGTGVVISVPGGTYSNITPDQLAELLKSKEFFFVNTHIPYEGEIDPTDAFIAFEENGPQRVGDYPADKNSRIVLYCRSGRMSTIVAEELARAGYTDVWNLDGGMIAWEQSGRDLLTR